MPDQAESLESPWWRRFFDDDYAAYGLAAIDDEASEAAAAFIIDALELEHGKTLFDQCCGLGRMSIPLARRGIHVIGMDLIGSYVEAARRRAAELNLPCTFHQGDAHDFITPAPCDAAINWFTSFGYDEDDQVNIQVLQRAYESLRPGGRFALDYHSTPAILAEFRASHIDRPKTEELDDLLILHENEVDFARGVIRGLWTAIYADGRRVAKPVETRLYLPHEIIGLLKRCGFTDMQLYGGVDKSPFARASRRCIVTARKP